MCFFSACQIPLVLVDNANKVFKAKLELTGFALCLYFHT